MDINSEPSLFSLISVESYTCPILFAHLWENNGEWRRSWTGQQESILIFLQTRVKLSGMRECGQNSQLCCLVCLKLKCKADKTVSFLKTRQVSERNCLKITRANIISLADTTKLSFRLCHFLNPNKWKINKICTCSNTNWLRQVEKYYVVLGYA